MFLDQFTSLESKNLITWKDANRRNYISNRQPAWYRLLESIVIENPNSRLLKPEYRSPPMGLKNINYKTLTMDTDQGKEWVSIWNFIIKLTYLEK